MGVTTEADEHLDRAREAIQTAIVELSKIVIERKCWGHDEYNKAFKDAMTDSLHKLIDIREKIAP